MNADPLGKETQLMEKVFKNPEAYPAINLAFATQGKIQDAVNDYLDAQKRANQLSSMNKSLTDTNVELQEQVSKLQAQNHDAYKELIYVKSFWLVRVLLKFSKALNSLPKLRIEW